MKNLFFLILIIFSFYGCQESREDEYDNIKYHERLKKYDSEDSNSYIDDRGYLIKKYIDPTYYKLHYTIYDSPAVGIRFNKTSRIGTVYNERISDGSRKISSYFHLSYKNDRIRRLEFPGDASIKMTFDTLNSTIKIEQMETINGKPKVYGLNATLSDVENGVYSKLKIGYEKKPD